MNNIKNNKGFTLVELLAVIVVLGIIALIGYSSIGNVIETAQKKADALSVANYAKAISQQYLADNMTNKSINYVDNSKIDFDKLELDYIGDAPSVTSGMINDGGEISLFGCTGKSNSTFSYVNGEVTESNINDKTLSIYDISNFENEYITNISYKSSIYTAIGDSSTLNASGGRLKIFFAKNLEKNKNYQLTLNINYLSNNNGGIDSTQIYFYGSEPTTERTSEVKELNLGNNAINISKNLSFELRYIEIRFGGNELAIDLNSLRIEQV